MSEKTRLQMSLQILRDLNKLRRQRSFDADFVDVLLEDHDMEGGWIRLNTREFQDMTEALEPAITGREEESRR